MNVFEVYKLGYIIYDGKQFFCFGFDLTQKNQDGPECHFTVLKSNKNNKNTKKTIIHICYFLYIFFYRSNKFNRKVCIYKVKTSADHFIDSVLSKRTL